MLTWLCRPTAGQLLQMPFFKNAKRKSYLVDTVLRECPYLVWPREHALLIVDLVILSSAPASLRAYKRSFPIRPASPL